MKKIIIGNWKMYPSSIKEAREKFVQIKKEANTLRNVQTIICPPFVYLGDLRKLATGHRVVIGAQNAHALQEGAYTGEVSPLHLQSLGITHVILGHSERRAMGETDEVVNKKVLTAIKAGLTIVLCIGEQERDQDGHYIGYLALQVRAALKGVKRSNLKNIIIAYEPIWAIGAHALRAASAADALEVSISIKKNLADMYGKEGNEIPILYGGSVDAKNAGAFLGESRVDGLLVGRASLDPKIFGEILKNAEKIK